MGSRPAGSGTSYISRTRMPLRLSSRHLRGKPQIIPTLSYYNPLRMHEVCPRKVGRISRAILATYNCWLESYLPVDPGHRPDLQSIESLRERMQAVDVDCHLPAPAIVTPDRLPGLKVVQLFHCMWNSIPRMGGIKLPALQDGDRSTVDPDIPGFLMASTGWPGLGYSHTRMAMFAIRVKQKGSL